VVLDVAKVALERVASAVVVEMLDLQHHNNFLRRRNFRFSLILSFLLSFSRIVLSDNVNRMRRKRIYVPVVDDDDDIDGGGGRTVWPELDLSTTSRLAPPLPTT